LLLDLIQVFIEERDNMLGQIKQAIESGNPAALRLSAHALKGAMDHLGAKSLASLARKLEVLGESKVTAGAQDWYDQLEQQSAQLTEELLHFKNREGTDSIDF